MLAKAYLAIGKNDKAMEAIEKSIAYYLQFTEKETEDNDNFQIVIQSPLVKKTEIRHYIRKDTIKKKLFEKLADKDIQRLCQENRFWSYFILSTIYRCNPSSCFLRMKKPPPF